MKVSVIVPVYNVESYLKKCLDSLINQDFSDYEIVIINDGSKDNSEEIILEYKEKYPKKIKYFKKENGGLSSARNLGIEKSRGNYLAFVDSDDYVDCSFIKCLYEKACKDDSDIVICDIEAIENNGTYIINGINNYSDNINKNFILSPASAPNKLYKKELFTHEIKFPLGVYYEDLATTPKLIKYAKKISYINKPLYKYIIRTGSIMHEETYNPKIEDIFKDLDDVYNFYKTNHLLLEYKNELEYLYIDQLLHFFGLKFMQFDESKVLILKIKEEMDLKFPTWQENIYFKKKNFKERIMCHLIYKNHLKLIRILRRK